MLALSRPVHPSDKDISNIIRITVTPMPRVAGGPSDPAVRERPGGWSMSTLRTIFTTVLLASALTTSFMIALMTVPETVSAYTVHDPIFIDGNADFIEANGVTGGSGTASDPYIIEGWDIYPTAAHGIWIENTTAHFIIRDSYVHDSGAELNGIRLFGCVNGTVTGNACESNFRGIWITYARNVTLSNNKCTSNIQCGICASSLCSNNYILNNNCSKSDYGIMLVNTGHNNTLRNNICYDNNCGIFSTRSSSNTLVENNCSSNNDDGIQLDKSSNNSLKSNTCDANDYEGIFLHSSSDNTLSDNRCLCNINGIGLLMSDNNFLDGNNCSLNLNCGSILYHSNNNTMGNNSFSENGFGIDIFESSNNTIIGNNALSNTAGGIVVSGSAGTTAYHNIFFDNTDHVFDDSGSENLWNASYPVGGNYWDNYTGADEFRGPNQDQPGPDGIGDTPYVIDSNSSDYYPLMEPLPNTPPTASFTVSPPTGDLTTVFSFDASDSWDSEDMPGALEVRWDFDGDGDWDTDWSTEKLVHHQYDLRGDYAVQLEIRDTCGLTDNATITVEVLEAIPEFSGVLVPVLLLLLVMAFIAWRRRSEE
jgi:parallel beta-helix repeat protein